MISDPLTVPVLPAAPAPPRPPRYLAVLPDPEPGRPPLRRIVRADGFPLGYVPPPKPAPEPEPAPDPLPEAMGLRLFTNNVDTRLERQERDLALLLERRARKARSDAGSTKARPVDPTVPAFAPADIVAARAELGGISQRDLADLLGCSRGAVGEAERPRGRRRGLNAGCARALAALLARRRAARAGAGA